jgi:hypothetical protein
MKRLLEKILQNRLFRNSEKNATVAAGQHVRLERLV